MLDTGKDAAQRRRWTFYEAITFDPEMMGGVACVRGLRIPVAAVVGMVAEGMTVEAIEREELDLGIST